jgi:uncharacterized HAD superfamily protein
MLGFDIDGVVANFNEVFRQVVLDKTGIDTNHLDQSRFELKIPGQSQEEITAMVNESINRFVFEMQPYPGAVEAIWRLWDQTREPINFITARKLITEEATKRWLDEYIIAPYTLANNIRSAEKAEYLKEHGYTHYIDDRYRTVQQVKEHVPYTFLMDRPWNQREAVGVYRVFDLNDYVTEYLNWRSTNV